MRRIAVGPPKRLGILVVPLDVATDFPSQVRNRGENATRGQVTFDLGKPELDLIEPRRVRRREMRVCAGMGREKRLDTLRFVGGEIVDDQMDLSAPRLRLHDVLEERDECVAGCVAAPSADDFAGLRVERGIQRQGPWR